jgi:hypothetical protein
MNHNRRYDDYNSPEYKSIEALMTEYYERNATIRAEAKVHYDRFFKSIEDDIDSLERLNRL